MDIIQVVILIVVLSELLKQTYPLFSWLEKAERDLYTKSQTAINRYCDTAPVSQGKHQ